MSNAESAVELVINYLEAENILMTTEQAASIVNKWEAILDPIDCISLAAVAIANPKEIALSQSEIRQIKEFFFPSDNSYEDGFHI